MQGFMVATQCSLKNISFPILIALCALFIYGFMKESSNRSLRVAKIFSTKNKQTNKESYSYKIFHPNINGQ